MASLSRAATTDVAVPSELVLLTEAVSTRLDLPRYRRIMSSPTWGCVTQAVVATRSYVAGLDAGLQLLQFTDDHIDELSPHEAAGNRMALYLLVLDMLDRADEWTGYLAAWDQIRTHTDYTVTYSPDAKLAATRMAPYIIRREPHVLHVHFLWLTSHRRAVIARKVQAQREGRRLGNRWHRPQDELSLGERRRRVQRLVAVFMAQFG